MYLDLLWVEGITLSPITHKEGDAVAHATRTLTIKADGGQTVRVTLFAKTAAQLTVTSIGMVAPDGLKVEA